MPARPANQPIYIATGNAHKVREMTAILDALSLVALAPPSLPHVEETGETFAENARIKARAAADFLGAWALSDDSGLSVECLGGAPGVRSARFALDHGCGSESDARQTRDTANNELLVQRLKMLGVRDPAAAFVCHVALAAPGGEIVAQAEGRVEGVIRWPLRPDGGFGYDPLFHHVASNKRFSELTPERKNAISHRAVALRLLAEMLFAR